jgi:hypothetical protein
MGLGQLFLVLLCGVGLQICKGLVFCSVKNDDDDDEVAGSLSPSSESRALLLSSDSSSISTDGLPYRSLVSPSLVDYLHPFTSPPPATLGGRRPSTVPAPLLNNPAMLSSLTSIPSGISSFLSKRRRSLTWIAGTVGGAYLLGQWGLKKMGDLAEKARRETLDKDKCAPTHSLPVRKAPR